VLRPENRKRLRESGTVVWLSASVESILQRMARDETTAGRRPQLTTLGAEAEVARLLAERAPWYRECADLVVDTDSADPAAVAEEILRWLDRNAGRTGPGSQ
jgi:shikimate kinase